jgi:hypothetical protein
MGRPIFYMWDRPDIYKNGFYIWGNSSDIYKNGSDIYKISFVIYKNARFIWGNGPTEPAWASCPPEFPAQNT